MLLYRIIENQDFLRVDLLGVDDFLGL